MIRFHARVCAGAIAFTTFYAASALPAAAQNTAGRAAGRGPAPSINYDTAHLEHRLQAARATGPIALDGVLDEPSWAAAPMAGNFIQNDPREGQPASFPTEVRVLYDDAAMYFGVRARDDEPGRLIVNDISKDFDTSTSDAFTVLLDTFHDARNGYLFATNPAGAKWDAQMSNEGRENNVSWDGIWDVATRVAEDGWYAEMRIPFRTLKFTPADVQTWGVNFERRTRRLNEDSYWSPLPRIYDLQRASMAGSVEGLRGLRPGLNLRVKPFAATASSSLAGRPTNGDFDAGIDVKYGVTTGFVWDFTVNTDFAQVEADEQQINLTRFNLFFPEKRDFFLENSGIFQFGGAIPRGGGEAGQGGGIGAIRNQEMRLFFSRRIGLSDAGDAIPILAGTRLTGRQGAYSVGVLNIQQREDGPVPGANFTALRVRRDILANSDIGVMILNKEEQGAKYNRVAGIDANFRFGYFTYNAFVARSISPDRLLPEEGNPYATRARFEYQSPTWQAMNSYGSIGGRFHDELGYVPRLDVHIIDGRYGPKLRPARLSRWLRQSQPHYEYVMYLNRADGHVQSAFHGLHQNFIFQNGSVLEAGANPQIENVPAAFTISSSRGIQVGPGRHTFTDYFASLTVNPAARFSTRIRLGTGGFYDGHKRYVELGPVLNLNESFNASVNLALTDISLPGGSFLTKLLTARVNYSFNTKMFFNGLIQYNNDNGQWTSNLRFNIIHRPLSDFFLVYNERRDQRTGDMISRAVIAKMTYLVAF